LVTNSLHEMQVRVWGDSARHLFILLVTTFSLPQCAPSFTARCSGSMSPGFVAEDLKLRLLFEASTGVMSGAVEITGGFARTAQRV
jgi:hypothetical protein